MNPRNPSDAGDPSIHAGPSRRPCRKVSTVTVMKLRTIIITIALAGFADAAAAGRAVRTLQPVIVSGAAIAQCVPPNGHPGQARDRFKQLVHANCSAREIGMLVDAWTPYPESLSGGIERQQKRHQTMLREYLAAQYAAGGHIAAK